MPSAVQVWPRSRSLIGSPSAPCFFVSGLFHFISCALEPRSIAPVKTGPSYQHFSWPCLTLMKRAPYHLLWFGCASGISASLCWAAWGLLERHFQQSFLVRVLLFPLPPLLPSSFTAPVSFASWRAGKCKWGWGRSLCCPWRSSLTSNWSRDHQILACNNTQISQTTQLSWINTYK